MLITKQLWWSECAIYGVWFIFITGRYLCSLPRRCQMPLYTYQNSNARLVLSMIFWCYLLLMILIGNSMPGATRRPPAIRRYWPYDDKLEKACRPRVISVRNTPLEFSIWQKDWYAPVCGIKNLLPMPPLATRSPILWYMIMWSATLEMIAESRVNFISRADASIMMIWHFIQKFLKLVSFFDYFHFIYSRCVLHEHAQANFHWMKAFEPLPATLASCIHYTCCFRLIDALLLPIFWAHWLAEQALLYIFAAPAMHLLHLRGFLTGLRAMLA